jgi:putative membrane protein insertion efficiency factor
VRRGWTRRSLWVAGAPARLVLIALIRLYRLTLGQMVGGGCRFHPSCSHYAEEAIRNTGVLRGSALGTWRVLRCSPLSKGGVDYPPQPLTWRSEYVAAIQPEPASGDDNIIRRARRDEVAA